MLAEDDRKAILGKKNKNAKDNKAWCSNKSSNVFSIPFGIQLFVSCSFRSRRSFLFHIIVQNRLGTSTTRRKSTPSIS